MYFPPTISWETSRKALNTKVFIQKEMPAYLFYVYAKLSGNGKLTK
jgi:hypothetical protein